MSKIIAIYDENEVTYDLKDYTDIKKCYLDILKDINSLDINYDFKKYAIIKPSSIFENIQEQTNILFDAGFNVVFEFLNDRDDFKITYISSEDNNRHVWILPFNKLKRDNKFNNIRDISSKRNIRTLKRSVNLTKKDINMANIFQSVIYFIDACVDDKSENYRLLCILMNYFKSPIVSSVRNIKCAFIGDFIFDKDELYENEDIKVTLKYSHE